MVKKQHEKSNHESTRKLINKVRSRLYSHGYSKAEVNHKMTLIMQKVNEAHPESTCHPAEKDKPLKDQRLDHFARELDLLDNKHFDNYDSSESESYQSKVKVENRPKVSSPKPKREERQPELSEVSESPIEWRVGRDRLERLAMERERQRQRTLYQILSSSRPRRPRHRQQLEMAEPIRRIMMRRRQLQMQAGMPQALGIQFNPRNRREFNYRYRIE